MNKFITKIISIFEIVEPPQLVNRQSILLIKKATSYFFIITMVFKVPKHDHFVGA